MWHRTAASATSGTSPKLEAGGSGDGMAIDSDGRLYVTTAPGVQVISPEGKYLGVIPAPRAVISAAFSGPDKKVLYVVGSGALGPDGKEYQTPPGVRNNGKTIYSIPMLARGFKAGSSSVPDIYSCAGEPIIRARRSRFCLRWERCRRGRHLRKSRRPASA